jgi:hypothetical protein
LEAVAGIGARGTSRLRTLVGVGGSAVVIGLLASYKALLAPGIIGLIHDWSVAPTAAQNVALAKQIFNGWYTWGLGAPVVYPTEYPLKFAMGAIALAGADGEVLSKMLVAGIPALAFLSAAHMCSKLRISPWAACVAGAFYALNPVMLNKLVSGQSAYLFGYAVMPTVLASFLNSESRRHFLMVGLETGVLVSLAGVQIQLGVFAYGLLILAALCFTRPPFMRRAAIVLVATIVLSLVELPTILGLLYDASWLETLRVFQPNPGWIASNSAHLFDAVRLSGYLIGYDVMSMHGSVAWWTGAGFIVAAVAVLGYAWSPQWARCFALVCGPVTLLFVCGLYSPAAALIEWLFLHIRFMETFRELYHAMAILALVYAIGIGFFFHGASENQLVVALRAVALAALGFYCAPMLSGNVSGWLQNYRYGKDMSAAYAIVSRVPERTVWLPMDQPLSYDGRGAGVDPMSVSRYGSLWLYSLAWPLSAVDMAARSQHWAELQVALDRLSVGYVVERRLFNSRLSHFIDADNTAMSRYLQEPVPIVQLPGSNSARISRDTTVIFLRGVDPLAFSTDRVAIAPSRLDTLPWVPPDAVPLPYGTQLPTGVPYVVVTRPENAADEALATYPQLQVPTATFPDQGFAPIESFWWYRPAYADARSGWLTVGRHVAKVSVTDSMSQGMLELSFQATPVGGRLRVGYGDRTWTFDTNGPVARVFSRVIDLGRVSAGSQISLSSEDADDDVALLSCRLLEKSRYREAMTAFAAMLHDAQRVIEVEPPKLVYAAPISGRGPKIGALDAGRMYSLQVAYSARRAGYAEVVGDDGYVVARNRIVALARGTVAMKFDGARGEYSLRLSPALAHLVSWRLWHADRVRASVPLQEATNPAEWRPDGSAAFRNHLPLLVVNESFSSAFRASTPMAAHVGSIFGTNVFVSSKPGPVQISNAHAALGRVAYMLGCLLIATAVVSYITASMSISNPRE